ncbi:polysaccharide pyruvyl transferase family protein [Leucobacter sp. HY1910]
MRVIVIGDISGGGNYHLGDEAMSEVAVQQLQQRGAEVTIIADRPEISAPLYGVPAVRRFELWREKTREKKLARMDLIMRAVRGEAELPDGVRETTAAVRAADAIVVAGGGNLNSHMTENHLLERLLLARIAGHDGIPLYISSQTVGPVIVEQDRALLRELACSARVFGAREASTAELMRELCDDDATVVHTLDDVILMDPNDDARAAASSLELPERYAVASFTMHSGTTGLTREAYYRKLAAMLDKTVEQLDVDIVLLPHMGKLGHDNTASEGSDVYGHGRIVHYARTERVRSLEMMTSEALAAVTANAQFTLSTRYHPVVFGAGLGVPAVSLVTSYYSAVRMRGALKNVGMESLAIPFEAWDDLFGEPVLAALTSERPRLDAHISAVRQQQRAYQSAWWDGIVADAAGSGAVVKSDLVPPAPFEWADAHTRSLLTAVRINQEKSNLHELAGDIARMERERDEAVMATQLRKARTDIERLQAEVAHVRHRQRPLGAGLRDKINAKLRK